MPDIRYSQSVVVGGVTISGHSSRSAEGQISEVVPLPAAKAGILSDRTSGTVGELTLGAGHGITTGMTINVYWSGGRRYGVTVGEVAGLVVPISLGDGDNLPEGEDPPITAAQVIVVDVDFEGDLAILLAASATKAAHLDVQTAAGGQIVAGGIDLAAGEPWVWIAGGSLANPLEAATVGKLATANSATTAGELRFGVLYDSVP